MSIIGDWFVDQDDTYLRIFGLTKPPHLLAKFVTKKVILQEIVY